MSAITNPRMRIDRHALHEYLWRKSNRRHLVRAEQSTLAEALGISKWTMSRVMHELIDAGRIKKVPDSVSSYIVADPVKWR